MMISDNDRIPMLEPYTVEEMVAAMSESEDYNHRMLNIPEMWKRTKGEGVRVVVLDTGMPIHVDIKVAGGKNFSNSRDMYDRAGHGSHVAGIIAATEGNGIGVKGIAPKCELYCGKVLGDDGAGSIASICEGIYWAVDEVKADVINMSLGCSARNGAPASMRKACEYAASKGVVICAAAGNDGGTVNAPACVPSTIAVAAIDSEKNSADFTCHGSEVDFAAGGVDVFSTWLNDTYAKLSGTSMATPVISGVCALIISDFTAKACRRPSTGEVYAELMAIADDIGVKGKDAYTGYGIPIFGDKSSQVKRCADTTGGKWWFTNLLSRLFSLLNPFKRG